MVLNLQEQPVRTFLKARLTKYPQTNSNGLSGKIEDIKISEEGSPLTPLSERMDMNLGEKFITTEKKLVVLIHKLRSTIQNPDSCAKELLIDDLRSTNMWRIIV